MKDINQKLLQGFTLVELLVVVAIMAITLAFGVPSFQAVIASSRLTNAANSMVTALQLARSEAIKTNRLVTVSNVNNNSAWGDGWIVFMDKNQDNLQDIDDDPEIDEPTIGSFDAINTSFTVKPDPNFTNRVIYRPDGRSNTFGSFTFCSPAETADFRNVVIASTGRVRVETLKDMTYAAAGCP
ncbi:MAG: GspH/FimT family pseudopilin [Methylococcaceae bacterium]